MGFGAYMRVTNNKSTPVTTLINDVECMYDSGEGGSNPSYFNNLTIPPGQTLPSGVGQYIEAKDSGTCFFVSSHFTLQVIGGNAVFITESGHSYSGESATGVAVHIDNSGDQAQIDIRIS
ncbi:MAG TPA: hypothetical protein VGC13_32245 [Longimicrobium sp.]|jgi:hypothetical protein|uniref:hypothetical protein n=1 Tax=Longimicrobium sp. TaxID=2029185 RepID=UPI002EDACBC1